MGVCSCLAFGARRGDWNGEALRLLAIAGAGMGYFVGLSIARPGQSMLPGIAIGALLGALVELFAVGADRLVADSESNDGPRAR